MRIEFVCIALVLSCCFSLIRNSVTQVVKIYRLYRVSTYVSFVNQIVQDNLRLGGKLAEEVQEVEDVIRIGVAQ